MAPILWCLWGIQGPVVLKRRGMGEGETIDVGSVVHWVGFGFQKSGCLAEIFGFREGWIILK